MPRALLGRAAGNVLSSHACNSATAGTLRCRQTIAEYVPTTPPCVSWNIGVDFGQRVLLGEPQPLDVAFS